MAEILLKIGANAGYEDGDVLCAFNRRRTRCAHAEQLCHQKYVERRSDGRRPAQSLARWLREYTYQYRFERKSNWVVERVEIATGERVEYSNVPKVVDGVRQQMDVPLFVRQRLKHERHAIFGDPGKEIWYGGRYDRSHDRLDQVWTKISELTDRTEAEEEFQAWPMGRLDIRHHLAVRVVDFSDEEGELLVRPQYELDANEEPIEDENGSLIVLAKRNIRVDWRTELLDDLKVTESQVLNRDVAIGVDKAVPVDRLIHRSKPQPEQADRGKLHSKAAGGRATWT